MTLKEDLTNIRGVGDSTAESIIEVLDEQDTTDTSGVKELLQEALAYYEQEDYEHVKEHVEEAIEQL